MCVTPGSRPLLLLRGKEICTANAVNTVTYHSEEEAVTKEYPKELYGGMAPHNKTETSRAAAEAVTQRAHTIREQVYDEIKASGGRGKTCDELEVLMNRPHTTVSARIRELCLQGRVEPVGRKRKTRWSRDARVYVVTGPRVSCDACDRVLPYKGEDDADDLENGWTIEYDVPGAMDGIVYCNVCRDRSEMGDCF